MTRLFSLFFFLAALSFISCTTNVDLVTNVTVLEHASCAEDASAMIKLEALGGTTPYVYTLWDLSDNSMIVSQKTEEGIVIVGKKDLMSLNYKYILTDSEGLKIEEEFQIIPEGRSVISSQLTMEREDLLITPENIEIQLTSVNSEDIETTYTDSEGRYVFENLSAGSYTLEVILHNKYDDYALVPKNSNAKVRVEPGTHQTRPFTLACDDSFDADLVLTY